MAESKRDDFNFFFPIEVRWGEMDALGHVNNTVFYRYSEEGRLRYLAQVSPQTPDASTCGPILANLSCNFLQQLQYPARVEVATRTAALGKSSMHVEQALFHAGTDDLVANYTGVLVWFDYKQQTSIEVPEDVRAKIRAVEKIAPKE